MGAPSIDISFIEKGITAITRGERGIVMLWVKDTIPAPAVNPTVVVTESDIPEGLSDVTVEQVKLAMIGYTNAPKKVLIYCMGIAEDAEAAAIEAGYKKAMEASETITPAALFTTLCATSNTPMTIFQVLDTISTAQAVLNIHLKNIQVSISCILFRSVTI